MTSGKPEAAAAAAAFVALSLNAAGAVQVDNNHGASVVKLELLD